jgi:hypothetical protein
MQIALSELGRMARRMVACCSDGEDEMQAFAQGNGLEIVAA